MMDDIQHPLVMSSTPPLRGPVDSPAPAAADEMATNLTAHRDSMSEATNKFEQQPSASAAFRGRSKSIALGTYAWTSKPPRPPVDYFSCSTASGVPYKARSWEPTLERAIKAIVSIKASHVRSFDTETSGKILLLLYDFKAMLFKLILLRWLYRHRLYRRRRERYYPHQSSCSITCSYCCSSRIDKL